MMIPIRLPRIDRLWVRLSPGAQERLVDLVDVLAWPVVAAVGLLMVGRLYHAIAKRVRADLEAGLEVDIRGPWGMGVTLGRVPADYRGQWAGDYQYDIDYLSDADADVGVWDDLDDYVIPGEPLITRSGSPPAAGSDP